MAESLAPWARAAFNSRNRAISLFLKPSWSSSILLSLEISSIMASSSGVRVSWPLLKRDDVRRQSARLSVAGETARMLAASARSLRSTAMTSSTSAGTPLPARMALMASSVASAESRFCW